MSDHPCLFVSDGDTPDAPCDERVPAGVQYCARHDAD